MFTRLAPCLRLTSVNRDALGARPPPRVLAARWTRSLAERAGWTSGPAGLALVTLNTRLGEGLGQALDSDQSGGLDSNEFCAAIKKLVRTWRERDGRSGARSPSQGSGTVLPGPVLPGFARPAGSAMAWRGQDEARGLAQLRGAV